MVIITTLSEGQWHGRGQVKAVDETSYSGEWDHGRRNGHGVAVEGNGERYAGTNDGWDTRYEGDCGVFGRGLLL